MRAISLSQVKGLFEKNFSHLNAEYWSRPIFEYLQSGLTDGGAVGGLETGNEQQVFSLAWEAALWQHLCKLGYAPSNRTTKKGQSGPDFLVESNGQKIWIEAVAPVGGDDFEWEEGELGVRFRNVNGNARILGCASSIKQKMEHRRIKEVVGADECLVVAVHVRNLAGEFGGLGQSGFPVVAEALFPIGAKGYSVPTARHPISMAAWSPKPFILNRNDSDVLCDVFASDRGAHISAVLQAHHWDVFGISLSDLSLIHNPFAANPLPCHVLGARREFVAFEERGWQLTELLDKAAPNPAPRAVANPLREG